jgi:dephospho-CoA kinase
MTPEHPPARPFVVGITGGIGSGKSEAARAFARLGAEVIDADRLGHEALREPAVIQRLTERFGEAILDRQGQVERARLASVVFNNPEARRALESVTHPVIRRKAEALLAASRAPLAVLDAALLFEAGWHEMCDAVVFIDAPDEVRWQRVHGRSGWDEGQWRARESAQLPLTDKRQLADHVLMNGSTPEDLFRQAASLTRQWGLAPESPSQEGSPQ